MMVYLSRPAAAHPGDLNEVLRTLATAGHQVVDGPEAQKRGYPQPWLYDGYGAVLLWATHEAIEASVLARGQYLDARHFVAQGTPVYLLDLFDPPRLEDPLMGLLVLDPDNLRYYAYAYSTKVEGAYRARVEQGCLPPERQPVVEVEWPERYTW